MFCFLAIVGQRRYDRHGRGDQDHIKLAELVEVLPLGRRFGVLGDEGIDQDHLSAQSVHAKSRLSEPQQLGLPLTRQSRRSER